MKRKFFPVYTIALIGLLATYHKAPPNVYEPCIIQTDTLAIAPKLLTLTDAKMIMGGQVKLTGNTFIKKGDTLEYKCDYTSTSQDEITGKTGRLYFMYEIYDGVAAAANAFGNIYQANSKHKGIKIETGLGDEAYYHSDQTGFYFALVRKNKKMFRLKLNKVTSHSSETAFKEVAKRIVDRL